jgi:amidase
VAELEKAGRLLESLGHHVEWAVPKVDLRAAFAAQTTCYITNFAQTIAALLRAKGLETPPADLVERMNIRIWEAGIGAHLFRADGDAGGVQPAPRASSAPSSRNGTSS